ncbi:MAG: methylmalonyl-CoA mutase family protein, partial [Saprospiraceae bacterium]
YGGMTTAIENGIPKLRIEEAAAIKQARIDSGIEKIIGVNYLQQDTEVKFDILDVDNQKVLNEQKEKLKEIKASRNSEKVNTLLESLTKAAADGNSNLLELAIQAARERATLGEISFALEKVYGRYQAVTRISQGVYLKEYSDPLMYKEILKLSDEFAHLDGRRPRILVAKLGQDGHDRGAKIISTGFADLGFDVDIGPLFQTAEEAARQACENDVHVLGISSLAAGHKTLVPKAIKALKEMGREDILVIVGGVIPEKDYQFLMDSGVAGIFGPGTPIPVAAKRVLELLKQKWYPESL